MARAANYIADLEEYQRLYKSAGGFLAIGDASPSYLWDENAPQRIHEVCPRAKIIVILRDPVVRAYSHYLMDLLAGLEHLPFAEAVRQDYARKDKGWWISHLYVETGLYHDCVLRYLDIFGSDQVMVLLIDELTRNPQELFSRVAGHIGVDPRPFHTMRLSRPHNIFKMPLSRTVYRLATRPIATRLRSKLLPAPVNSWLRNSSLLFNKKKPPLDGESRQFLQEIFDPDISRLEGLLKRDLRELRGSWI